MSRPLLLALVLVGCNQQQRTPGAFDTPSALAVLEPATGGPFTQPVGYAANVDGGRIAAMALTSGTFLADDANSFLQRSTGLATGEGRRIGGLAAYAPSEDRVSLFAADKAYGHLIELPHIIGVEDGEPIELDATASTPAFVDADDSGDTASLRDVVVYQGAAATEEWVIRFDGEQWWVEGSRSGRLPVPATTGEAYTWDRPDDIDGARLKPPFTFVIEVDEGNTVAAGDEFRLATDNGLIEHDVGGTPLHLAMAPDQSTLAVVVSADSHTELALVDPATAQVSATASLAADAVPGRMDWAEDGTLFAADNMRAAFWEVTPSGDATEHVLPWPTVDVAALTTSTDERLVYLVPVTSDAVWVYDLEAGSLRDVNPWMEGVQGMPTQTQVRGIAPIDTAFTWPEEDRSGAPLHGKAVAVSLSSGFVQLVEEGTGCFIRDLGGPRTVVQSTATGGDIETNFGEVPGGPFLQGNGTNGRAVQVNPCGGVAWTESWRARYDQTVQAWRVEGTLSGPQEALAYEGQRYLSDRGQVSFLIQPGATASLDGWTFTFSTRDGLLRADGDNDLDDRVDVPLDLPGDPVAFTAAPLEELAGGWQQGEDRPFVLIPAEAADLVARMDPRYGTLTPFW